MDTAPAPEQQASSVDPSPATRALCGQILSPLWNSISHCKMSGFRGSGSVSGVLDEVVVIDRHAEGRATEQAVGMGPEVVFLDSSHLGICPLHFADGKRRVRGAGGCCEGQGFPCYSQPLGPTPHHNSHTAISPPPFPAGPGSPLTRDRTGPLSSEIPADLLCGAGLLLALSGSWLLLCGPEEDLVVPECYVKLSGAERPKKEAITPSSRVY